MGETVDEFKFEGLTLNEIADKALEEFLVIDKKIQGERKIHDRRKLIATELFTTERTYVTSLQIVSEYIIDPLTNRKKPILTAAEVKRIFATWKSITNCHIEILELLKERINSWGSNRLIGDAFADTKMNSITQLYKYYINNFDRSIAVLEHYRQKSGPFKKFLDHAMSTHAQGLDLGGYLIMPVQRIPRYVMLFESLLKCTKKSHPDYSNLEKAHERFRAMADFINMSKKIQKNLTRPKKICGTIKGFPTETLLSTPGVALIKSGNLLEQTEQPENFQKVFVVLLNNCLVIAESKKTVFQFKANFPLLKAQIFMEKAENVKPILVLVPTRDETTVFVGDDKSAKFRLTADSEEEMDSWYQEVTKAVAEAAAIEKEFGKADITADDTSEEVKPIDKKRHLVDAFIQKEVEYVHHLKGLKEFMDNNLMTLEEKETHKSPNKANIKKLLIDFFDSIKPIIGCHVNMLALLFERMAQWQEKDYCIGDIFEKNFDFAAPRYNLYSLLWEEIRSTFLETKNDMKILPVYKFWGGVAKFESDHGIKMEVFLEQISQRIPFWANVIMDIAKNSPTDSPDTNTLEVLHMKVKILSDKILTLKEIALEQRQEIEQEVKKKSTRYSLRKALTLGAEKKKEK